MGSYCYVRRDRYGNWMVEQLANGFALDRNRRTATWEVEFKVGNQGSEMVRFKNISLVPGENQGFEIELAPPTENPRLQDSVRER